MRRIVGCIARRKWSFCIYVLVCRIWFYCIDDVNGDGVFLFLSRIRIWITRIAILCTRWHLKSLKKETILFKNFSGVSTLLLASDLFIETSVLTSNPKPRNGVLNWRCLSPSIVKQFAKVEAGDSAIFLRWCGVEWQTKQQYIIFFGTV